MRVIAFCDAYAGRAVAALAATATLSVFLYGAFLLGAVAHAAGRTQAERQISALGGKLGELESQYLEATKSLSPERASALGFVAPHEVVTVYTGASTLTLANGIAPAR